MKNEMHFGSYLDKISSESSGPRLSENEEVDPYNLCADSDIYFDTKGLRKMPVSLNSIHHILIHKYVKKWYLSCDAANGYDIIKSCFTLRTKHEKNIILSF